MDLEGLLREARGAVPERVWGAAVELARGGAVMGVGRDDGEIHLRVKGRRQPVPHEVFLWPEESDWECDCDIPSRPCLHIVAGLIAAKQGIEDTGPKPKVMRAHQVRVTYAFRSEDAGLHLQRHLVFADGRREPLRGALDSKKLLVARGDAQADKLLAHHVGGMLSAELLRRLLVFLEGDAEAILDGEPIVLSDQPVTFRVKVRDEGPGFRVGLYTPDGVDTLFRGAARIGSTLHPTSHGQLNRDQRRELVRGVYFGPDQVTRLVKEYLPRLRYAVPVDVESTRVPSDADLTPRVVIDLREVPQGLRLLASLEYGDPPFARVLGSAVEALGDVVPARDLGAERTVARAFEQRMGISVGIEQVFEPSRAAAFLRDELPRYDGVVRGSILPRRFQVVEETLVPHVDVQSSDEEPRSWRLDVEFAGPRGGADPLAVIEAWRSGRSLVALLDGGYAPLPADWLEKHGPVLRELLEARDTEGRVDRHASAALAELLEGTEGHAPPDLTSLQHFLAGEEGLPEAAPPPDFRGELRPYQRAGYAWLRFLRQMDLSGILADDMGLGKTVQALVAMRDAGGRSLVIAPTSVLVNWQREAERFLPGISICVYHGPTRELVEADLTVTSYALLRLDLDVLREVSWTYVVLDEAQAIKNARSQTARAAYLLRATHRLALTGTPVENRLEELWSQFRFLMPGLLGSAESFRDRFVKPIEAGDADARALLRTRVRPYVLRRMKTQVAPELPSLTDMVIRCEMEEPQRRVYEAVRLAAREDVQRALDRRGAGGATMQVLEALLRMRQACCDPALLPGDTGAGAPSCKLDRLEELLLEIVCEDHKALIFSQWTSMLDRVELRLAALGIDWVRLDGSTRDRQAVVDAFQSPTGPPLFLLSLKAGGLGLNLTAADYVVHLDPWWNPAVQQQATDRAWRIGQDRPVVSCRFIAEATVEERILELQDAKRDLADAALGTEGGFVRALSAAELRILFEVA